MIAEIHVSPSGLQRALNCTGQPMLAEGLPKQSSPEATLGTIAHLCILNAVKAGDPGEVLNQIDGLDRVSISFETAQAWEQRAADLLGLIGKKPISMEVEAQLSPWLQLLGMRPSGREGEHQADLIWQTKQGWNVLDYKNGKTAVPEPKDNDQLKAYAFALMKRAGLKNSDELIDLWIYQPEISREAFHGAISVGELKAWGDLCMDGIEEMQTGGHLKEGAWCQWCAVAKAGACPLLQRRKEDRKQTVDLAKAGAGEMALQLVDMKDYLAVLPAVGADIMLPESAVSAVAELVAKESEMLAVGKGNEAEASGLLKELGLYEGEIDKARAMMKKPYLEAGKAVDDAFKALSGPLEAAKKGIKGKLQSWLETQERARRAEEARQKAEQDKLAADLKAKEEEAAKLSGAARKAADLEALNIRNAATAASVVPPPAAPAKIAGVAAKEVFTFDIPEVGKIPDRYLIKHEGPLKISGAKPVVIVEVDGAVLAKDAVAGRLAAATWLSYSSSKAVSAR